MRVALIGYGKMGKAIEGLLKSPDEVVLRIDIDSIDQFDRDHLSQADVAIEFTGPASAADNLMKCLGAGIPVVCGSTGWYDRLEKVTKSCERHDGALFYAPNFSIGVNLFFEVNQRLAAMMDKQPQYEVTIDETHHVHKKDAPSGTAIRLAEQVIKEVRRKKLWVNTATGKGDELIVLSHREGEVPGTHVVRWTSEADEITLEHKAHSRQGFAEGAILAARWIIGKKGVFTMNDLLKSL